MDLHPLTLPAAPEDPPRQPLPVLAALVPMATGVVLWLVTGSAFSLCFAALGPLMMGASLLDGMRTRRRLRRRSAAQAHEGWSRAEQEMRRRHRGERRELWRAHPDAAASITDPPLRDLRPLDEATPLVIGSGMRRSELRVSASDGERARAFQERASRLTGAPVLVPMGRGVCLRGPQPVVAAAARALVVQLCIRHGPAQLALTGEALDVLGLAGFPHAGRPRRGAWTLAVAIGDAEPPAASAQIRLLDRDADVPEGITTVVDCSHPSQARMRTANGVEDISIECLSRPQAIVVAAATTQREGAAAQLPDVVALSDITGEGALSGLGAFIGRTESGDLLIDLVEDGPHAIVTGMTGSGKSELLVTWIVSMARSHGPEEVTFVLADFKGGTAFDPLRDLPHVAAVVTDLDDEGARRGVESLTAELRRREQVLADLGVRSITEAGGRLERLVIVVDEFAALVQEYPDLAGVFTDIAARGRALGMHLILGTQRAAGVIRDALAANCPLRVSLRVTDAADSRLVIGSGEAAELPGGASSRGLALVRRPQDSQATAVRVALTGASDLRTVAVRWAAERPPASPWLPPLPQLLRLEELRRAHNDDDDLLLGLRDEPQRQRQSAVAVRPGADRGMAVVGGSGSGRTSLLRALAVQCPSALMIPADAEQAWDALAALDDGRPVPPLVLCDDLDQLTAAFPTDHAVVFVQRLERLVRSAAARRCTVVVATARVSGQLAKVVDALPSRVLLRTSTRMEHLAAGGDSDGYLRDRSPGRARIGDDEVQIAWVDAVPQPSASALAAWSPVEDQIGVVAPAMRRVVEALRTAYPEYDVSPVTEALAEPESAQRRILVGDADSWQRQWALWQQVRAAGEMLVLAECAAELRTLAGIRDLPPYAETHRGRAWSIVDGRPPRRVVLSSLDAAT